MRLSWSSQQHGASRKNKSWFFSFASRWRCFISCFLSGGSASKGKNLLQNLRVPGDSEIQDFRSAMDFIILLEQKKTGEYCIVFFLNSKLVLFKSDLPSLSSSWRVTVKMWKGDMVQKSHHSTAVWVWHLHNITHWGWGQDHHCQVQNKSNSRTHWDSRKINSTVSREVYCHLVHIQV